MEEHDLSRFVNAQQTTYELAVEELRKRKKTSHWMWFIFPQIHGLSSSSLGKKFAIKNQQEATAYWAHDLLRSRYLNCVEIITSHKELNLESLFGYPDHLKFHSSLTLFTYVTQSEL